MTEPLPLPLVPGDVDLSGYEFMPLFGDRLFKSETWIGVSPEAKIAALRLWWHCYSHEVPASSLPDNDQFLAEYAGYGAMIKAWRRVKPGAMRGFVLCSDGRWYHRFLATVVLSAWEARQVARAKGSNGAAKRWGKLGHEKKIAGASEKDSSGNATAKKNDGRTDSKGKERKKDLGGESTSSTRGSEGQGPLKFSPKSTPPEEIEANREKARRALQSSGISEEESRAMLLARRAKA